MAQVPYQPISDVQPDATPPNDYQRVEANPSSFGGAIAQGAEKAGAGAIDLSKTWGRVQAQDAINNAEQDASNLLVHAKSLQGQDALDAQASLSKQLGDIQTKYRSQLGSTDAQLQFDSTTTPFINRFIRGSLDTHFVDQGKVVASNVNAKSFDNAITMATQAGSDGSSDPTAPTFWAKNVEVARAKAFMAAKTDAVQKGLWDTPDAQQAAEQKANVVYSAALEARALTKPDEAWARIQDPKVKAQLGENYDKTFKNVQETVARSYVSKADALGVDDPTHVVSFVRANEAKFGPTYGEVLARAQRMQTEGGGKALAAGSDAAVGSGWSATPHAPTPANAMHIGDSIATGTAAAQYGADWQSNPNVTARVGAPPSAVLDQLKTVAARGPDAFAGKDVVLSTGTSNLQADGAWNRAAFDSTGVKTIGQQLDTIKANGGDMSRVRVLGVGPNAGGDYANSRLQALAARYGAKFSSIPATDYGPGGVHTTAAGYSKLLGAPTSAAASASPAGHAQFAPGSFESALGRTFKEEGGYNSKDANGAPVNFGINQAAHPEVNVANLTRDQAAQIYKRDYWDKIDGDNLAKTNPALAHVAFDAAVISGVGRAQQWLAQSGGDAGKFMDLRDAYLSHLVASDPGTYAKYARVWQQRDNNLRADIGLAPRGTTSFVGGVPSVNSAEGGTTPAEEPAAAETQPAAFTTPAPTPPSPQTPEQITAGIYDRSAARLRWIDEQPGTPEEKDAAKVQVDRDQAFLLAAAGAKAAEIKAREDSSTEDVLGTAEKDGYQAAYQRLDQLRNDPAHPISAKTYAMLSEAVQRYTGEKNPVRGGTAYNDVLRRMLLPPRDPNRVDSYTQLVQMEIDGKLTQADVRDLNESRLRLTKDDDEYGLQSIKSSVLDEIKSKMTEGIDPVNQRMKNPYGLERFNTLAVAEVGAAFSAWRQDVKSGKTDMTTFPLSDPKKLDAFVNSKYPPSQRAYDKMRANADMEGSGALPALPENVKSQNFMKVVGSVAPARQQDFALSLEKLAADPAKYAPIWDQNGTGKIMSAQQALANLGVSYTAPTRSPVTREDEMVPQAVTNYERETGEAKGREGHVFKDVEDAIGALPNHVPQSVKDFLRLGMMRYMAGEK